MPVESPNPEASAPTGAAPSEGLPTRCQHHVAPGTQWPWLPTQSHGHLARHPWCTTCGSIAATGARALDMGGLVNEIAQICRALAIGGIRVTETQRRLMTKRLAALDAHDRFSLTRDAQETVLLRVVSQYTGIHPDTIATYTRAL